MMFDILLIILELSCIHVPLIFGAYISMSLMKVPDLSIEAAYVFGALVGARILIFCSGWPLVISFLLVSSMSLCAGAFVGLISSLLTTQAKIPPLLSSILTIGLFHGINQLMSRPSGYISLTNSSNVLNIFPYLPQHPELIMMILIALCFVMVNYLLFRTQLGHCFAIYGNNQQFFSFYGISTSYIFIAGIMISNALAGYAGFLSAQSTNFADGMMGIGKPLLCITALVLGKIFLGRYKKNITVLVAPLGIGCYFIIQQMLLQVGFNLKYFTAVQALLVLVVLTIAYRKKGAQSMNQLGV